MASRLDARSVRREWPPREWLPAWGLVSGTRRLPGRLPGLMGMFPWRCTRGRLRTGGGWGNAVPPSPTGVSTEGGCRRPGALGSPCKITGGAGLREVSTGPSVRRVSRSRHAASGNSARCCFKFSCLVHFKNDISLSHVGRPRDRLLVPHHTFRLVCRWEQAAGRVPPRLDPEAGLPSALSDLGNAASPVSPRAPSQQSAGGSWVCAPGRGRTRSLGVSDLPGVPACLPELVSPGRLSPSTSRGGACN